ncbi:small s [Fusarium beomiforme]|uniref:Small s n=1 Tax=Fusarium beomiforme TaxID=44412 RepID=A0A9P5AHL4_9HYPO|nr:small s [Fusarium beomiforme]
MHRKVQQSILRTCKGLLEVVDGQVVFLHRAVSELLHSEDLSNFLLGKVRKEFDSDLSIFKASVAWFKRKRFRSGEFVDLQPEPVEVSSAYVKSLTEFHKERGYTLLGFRDPKNKLVDVHWMNKAVNIRGGFDNEVHLREKRLKEHDPMKDIEDVVESLRSCLKFARRCDQRGNTVTTTWALLDNVEESLLIMAAGNQFNISDVCIIRGIYRYLVIEAGIQRYIANKLWIDPGYCDNIYARKYRSPLYSALGVVPHNLQPAQLSPASVDISLVKSLLGIGHKPNNFHYKGEAPWVCFVNTHVPDTLFNSPPVPEKIGIGFINEVSNLMLEYGANLEAHTELLDMKSRTWKVPVWFKFLILAHWVPETQQDTFERVFGMMLNRIPLVSEYRALLELKSGGKTYEWVPFPLWAICGDNFVLPNAQGRSLSGAAFVFRIFAGICEENMDKLQAAEWSRKYLSGHFHPDYPELEKKIMLIIPSSDCRTIGPTTISYFTRESNKESISCRISTAPTSIEIPEGIEVESNKDADYSDMKEQMDTILDEVSSIQSIDEDIQSKVSSIARNSAVIAAERQIADLLSRHPDLHFILDISPEFTPKERLERNIRRSLKLLYLKLREHTERHNEIQVLTTRMLKGRGSKTRISKRTVDDELALLLPRTDTEAEEIRPSFRKDRAIINNWILKTEPSARPDEKPQPPVDEHDDFELVESEHGTSEENESDSQEFQPVKVAAEFLMKGPPFQAFLTHLGLSLLSDSLRQIMHLASWGTIKLFDTPFEITISDRIKCSIEELTGIPWNWWPLKPPKVRLQRGYIRMNWLCHCGKPFWVDITPSRARVIERMLKNPESFAENHFKITHTRRNTFERATAWFKWNSEALLPITTPGTQGSQQSPSTGDNNRAQQGMTTTKQTNIPPLTIDDLRILFGIPMGFKTLHVIPISVKQPYSNVFPQSKIECRRMRGL